MKSLIPLAMAAILFPGLLKAQNAAYDNSTIRNLDLSRYLGTWYEIARFDHSCERGMDNVTAEYLLRDDGMVDVINSGWRNGKYKVANGKARQPDPAADPAHLEVSFFLFFFSDYNVMMLGDDYQVALVGSRSPEYLWILARTPDINDEILGVMLEEAERRGYDTGNLIWVDQSMNR
jgi:lipocalin